MSPGQELEAQDVEGDGPTPVTDDDVAFWARSPLLSQNRIVIPTELLVGLVAEMLKHDGVDLEETHNTFFWRVSEEGEQELVILRMTSEA